MDLQKLRASLSAEFGDPSVAQAQMLCREAGVELQYVCGVSDHALVNMQEPCLVRLELTADLLPTAHFLWMAAGRLHDNDGSVCVLDNADRVDNRSARAAIKKLLPHAPQIRVRQVYIASMIQA